MKNEMTPRQIVRELNKYIVGQSKAKRAVAIALRNRWRRQQVEEPLRNEITPKNILMIGPTGVGKTEIARRLAKLAGAPFIKVEATKFTEVGYVGRDVESIIRDLVDIAVKMLREEKFNTVQDEAEKAAIERIVDCLLPKPKQVDKTTMTEIKIETPSATRDMFRNKVLSGELDNNEIELDLAQGAIGVHRRSGCP